MPPSRDQLNQERLDALLAMLSDNQGGGPGSANREHLEAVQEVTDFGEAEQVAETHRNGEPAPDVGGRP